MLSTERRRVEFAALAFGFAVAMLLGCGRDSAARHPNVLVICIDALRADHLGVYGATPSPSPSLDAFTKSAVVFENATSVASWTKPSVPSLLTGLYPEEHGVYDNSGKHVDTLASGAVPLASILAAGGYRTAAFVENDQLVKRFSGLDRGFSLYFDGAGHPAQIVDRFLSWVGHDDAKPWFAYLHFLDPHFPYTPDDFTMGPDEAGRLKTRAWHWDLRGVAWGMMRDRVNAGTLALDAAALADLERLYSLEIHAVDAVVGRLLTLLEADGLLDRTMVIVTADHGEGFLEHGRLDHGYGPYQELLHVPLVIRLPGGERGGTRVAALAQNVDIAPTVLDRVGLATPTGWSSVSLMPTLTANAKEVRSTALALEQHGQWHLLGLRDRRFSYVRSEGGTREVAAPPVLPAACAPGTRVRLQGIFQVSGFVAGAVKHLAPGDLDTELQGPVEAIDRRASTIRVLGVTAHVPDGLRSEDANGEHTALVFDNLKAGDLVRLHGGLLGGLFEPTKVETAPLGSIEVEGVVKRIDRSSGRTVMLDLGDLVVEVDARARWRDFPVTEALPEPQPAPPAEAIAKSEQLFDRGADPREQHDIAAEQPIELARLRTLADEALAALKPPAPENERRAVLDDDARERLRALGYVE